MATPPRQDRIDGQAPVRWREQPTDKIEQVHAHRGGDFRSGRTGDPTDFGVFEAIERLQGKPRGVVAMVAMGMSLTEVSQVLGVSSTQTQRIYAHAIQQAGGALGTEVKVLEEAEYSDRVKWRSRVLADVVSKKCTVARAAIKIGVTERHAYKILRRYRQRGIQGLIDRRSSKIA